MILQPFHHPFLTHDHQPINVLSLLQAKRRAEGETVKARCLTGTVQYEICGNLTCADVILLHLGSVQHGSYSRYTSMDQQVGSCKLRVRPTEASVNHLSVIDSHETTRVANSLVWHGSSLFYKNSPLLCVTGSLKSSTLLMSQGLQPRRTSSQPRLQASGGSRLSDRSPTSPVRAERKRLEAWPW